jgi:hypothetical protein
MLAVNNGKLVAPGTTFASARAERLGAPVLRVLDPTTLRIEREIKLPTSTPNVVASGAGSLVLESPTSIARFDLSTMRVAWSVSIRGVSSATIDTSGEYLYDVLSPGSLTFPLQKRSAETGALLATASIPSVSEGFFSLAADGPNLFVSGGDPGGPGFLFFYRSSLLRLRSSSWWTGGATPGEIGGSTGPPFPTFGQFPAVDLSGGLLWVASYGQLACFNPTTGVLDAIGLPKAESVTGPIIVVRAGTYSLTWEGAGPNPGLVRLTLPRSCRG